MKPRIIKEIERIAGDRLTAAQRDEIAACAIAIMEDITRTKALDAIAGLQERIVSSNHDGEKK